MVRYGRPADKGANEVASGSHSAIGSGVLPLSIVDNSDPSGRGYAAPAEKDLNGGAINDADLQLALPWRPVFRIWKAWGVPL